MLKAGNIFIVISNMNIDLMHKSKNISICKKLFGFKLKSSARSSTTTFFFFLFIKLIIILSKDFKEVIVGDVRDNSYLPSKRTSMVLHFCTISFGKSS